MRNRFLYRSSRIPFSLFPPASPGRQYQVLHGTFGSGGGVRAGGGYICYDTAGQPVIGIVCRRVEHREGRLLVLRRDLVDRRRRHHLVLRRAQGRRRAPELVGVRLDLLRGLQRVSLGGRRGDVREAQRRAHPEGAGGSYTDETALAGTTYLYRIGAVSGGGEWYSQNVSLALPPKPTTLYQNYPNPFNPSTIIAFYLPRAGHVSLVIYDVTGSAVRTLVDGAESRPGAIRSLWDGTNDDGVQVGSGVYYYRLRAGKDDHSRRSS